MYTSIKINNYKCFVADNEPQGFDVIKPINVIIGKNNSGKSKLLEALGKIITQKPEELPFNGIFIRTIETNELERAFARNGNTDPAPFLTRWSSNSNSWEEVGKYLIGSTAIFTLQNQSYQLQQIYPAHRNPYWREDAVLNQIRQNLSMNPFENYRFLHLQAERDIVQEPIKYNDDISKSWIRSNAEGICGLISRMLNDESGNDKGWREYIEKDFLNLINLIVSP